MNFDINVRKLPPPNNIMVTTNKNPGQFVIVWDIVKNPDEGVITTMSKIENIKYNIYRGTSINGIYYKLNSEEINHGRYEDNTINRNPNIQYWYKISAIANYSNNEKIEGQLSQPIKYSVENTNRWFKKINERNMWILKNTGTLMDLYTRKIDGEHCPNCWDEVRGQMSNSNCTTCFGTGIIGGYEPMCQLYIRQKPAPQSLDLTNKGYIINSNPGSWTISDIQLKNRDVLINQQGIIFSITGATISHAAGYYFHQELQMKELDPTDVRYQIKRKTLYPTI